MFSVVLNFINSYSSFVLKVTFWYVK